MIKRKVAFIVCNLSVKVNIIYEFINEAGHLNLPYSIDEFMKLFHKTSANNLMFVNINIPYYIEGTWTEKTNADNKKRIVPIPQTAIDGASNLPGYLKQNPGY
jgi:hypothetical protein